MTDICAPHTRQTSEVMPQRPELCTLPTEIQHLIVLNLHPSAAIALKQTNRWFNTHVSIYRLDRAEVNKYLNWLENRRRNRNNYACFSCLRLKPQTAFTTTKPGSKSLKNGFYPFARFCLDCGIRDAKVKPFTLLKMAGDESKPKVFCGSCSSVQRSFCGLCCCCTGCLAKLRTWTGRAAQWHRNGGKVLCHSHFTQ